MSNSEQGIAQAQLAADQARLARGEKLQDRHHSGIGYLGERVFPYFGAIVLIGLGVLWATASSTLVIYGSFAIAVLLIFAWGWLRLRRVARIREERERQVAASQAQK